MDTVTQADKAGDSDAGIRRGPIERNRAFPTAAVGADADRPLARGTLKRITTTSADRPRR